MPNRSEEIKRGERDREKMREKEREEEADREKRSCTMRNGTVDRCRVIQIGCDRCNPQFAIINSHPARSSSKSITGTHGWKIFDLVLRDTRNHRVAREFKIPIGSNVMKLLLIMVVIMVARISSPEIETFVVELKRSCLTIVILPNFS